MLLYWLGWNFTPVTFYANNEKVEYIAYDTVKLSYGWVLQVRICMKIFPQLSV